MVQRIVLLLDMDYFYAQVEERDDPRLRGRPVAVCMMSAREGSLGAIAACNYPARSLGLRAGMPCFLARKTAPDAAFLPARRDYYGLVSDSIMEELRARCDALEQVSIDEAYMDVTSMTGFGGLEGFIKSLKDAVLAKEHLTCSVGGGPNKLIAKMAASVNKPDGHMIVPPDEVLAFITPMPVSKLHGVGSKTSERLAKLGVSTVGDLQRLTLHELELEFGPVRGKSLHDSCRGLDESQVTERVKEQYGRLVSAKADTRDEASLTAILAPLSEDVHMRLKRGMMDYRTASVVFVLSDMQMRTRSRSFPAPTQSLDALSSAAKALLREFLDENPGLIRRIGVVASNLTPSAGQKALSDY